VEGDLECLYHQKNNGSTNGDLDLQLQAFGGSVQQAPYWMKKKDGGRKVGLLG
jgi:hypothetical protein